MSFFNGESLQINLHASGNVFQAIHDLIFHISIIPLIRIVYLSPQERQREQEHQPRRNERADTGAFSRVGRKSVVGDDKGSGGTLSGNERNGQRICTGLKRREKAVFDSEQQRAFPGSCLSVDKHAFGETVALKRRLSEITEIIIDILRVLDKPEGKEKRFSL